MLEAKTLTIKKSTNKSGKVVNFVPEMVEDKEVYAVVNKNNEHCGYITEDLFNLLMEQDPEEKENRALFHRALGVNDEEKEEETLIFGKKIILDVSSTEDINDFEKIILSPVTYTKGAKPLTIKIGTFFTVQNHGKLFDINVKSDFIECENFVVSNLTSTKLKIELGHDEFFNIRTENSVNISNSLIKGCTLIGDIVMGHEQYKLSIDNSLLNNLKMTLMKSDLDEIPDLTIKNSELKGVINATGLERVEDSIIASSTLSNISKINGAIIEDKELDYNSYQKEIDEPKKDVGQATNEVEIL